MNWLGVVIHRFAGHLWATDRMSEPCRVCGLLQGDYVYLLKD